MIKSVVGLLWVLSVFFISPIRAQQSTNFWQEAPSKALPIQGLEPIQASQYRAVSINTPLLKAQLVGVKHRDHKNAGQKVVINLPHPDGEDKLYEVFENNTMSPVLKTKFPETRSYDAVAADGEFVKFDITPHGFHAMVFSAKGIFFIDPYSMGDTENYKVYFKRDFISSKRMDCDLVSNSHPLQGKKQFVPHQTKQFGTCELRTYRFAVAATGEYTQFHGGTVPLALAAQVTTMNRVNAIYERDMAITLTIVANNDQIIYTNSGTDPYDNGNTGAMINENQTNIDNVIGAANYDIGHVFGTDSGGLAGLGVVCSGGQKARGVTGSSAPVGDPFDIDYVAHETGHQFGANHTQNNNCNRNGPTAMEPGSASTIMGYAGICAPDVQGNSDAHFHGISLEEIHNEITSHNCPVVTQIANAAPVISGTNGNVTVPANTPFALTATAADADGDVLMYCWEQMNNTPSTQPPVATATAGPNFRSNPPVNHPTRYFPNLTDLAAGNAPTWEVVPSVSRTMNFRVTVRDQSVGVIGCNDHADVTLTTDANSGPFIVQNPTNTGIVWQGNGTQTVNWDVANTDAAPVSCSFVDILLSTDGGQTYPTVLASSVPNDGSQVVNVPNTGTTTARIMVICSNGTFFDISDNNFEISFVTQDYTLSTSTPNIAVCQPADAVYTIDVGEFGGFTDPVTLTATGVPSGATGSFGITPITPGTTTTFTVINTANAAIGNHSITIQANSTTGIKIVDLNLLISGGAPSVPTLVSPADMAAGVATPTTFTWTAGSAGDVYDIEIATDTGFTNVVETATALSNTSYTSTTLNPGFIYYWRVKNNNGCGASGFGTTFSFETLNEVVLPSTGTAAIQTNCTGTLFDSGGATGNYGEDEDAQITIAPIGATTVDLTFVSFGVEPGSNNNCDYDYLEIYDGPTPTASLLGRYCNDNIPTTISSAGNAITLVFHSDDDTNEAGFEMNWQCQLSTVPPVANFTSDADTTCIGTINFTNLSTNGPTNWNWDFGDGTTSTQPSPTHTYTTNGDYTVMLAISNAFGTDTMTVTDMIHVAVPTVPTGTGDVVCESQAATLTATGGVLLDWYDAPTGGTLMASGTSFTTPPLSTTTTFYVQSTVTNSSAFGAKPDSSGGGGNFNNNQWLVFNAFVAFEIVSVEVVASGAGNRTVELRDNTGTVLQSTTVNIPDGVHRIALGFNVPAGTNYQLGIDANGIIDLYRNNAGLSYPYDIAGLGSIVRSSANQNGGLNHYYFFYDWEVRERSCASVRVPVEATVLPAPGVSAGPDLAVCEGTSVTLSGTGANNYSWTGGVNDGQTFVPMQTATYTVTATGSNGCLGSDDVTVTVNVFPDTTVTESTGVLTAIAGYNYQWYNCDTQTNITGETGQSYTVTANGNYAVILNNANCVDTSSCREVIVIGIEEHNLYGLSVFPNPSSGRFDVQIGTVGQVEMEVTDVTGRIVMKKAITRQKTIPIDLSLESNGVYFLNVKGEKGVQSKKLLKQ